MSESVKSLTAILGLFIIWNTQNNTSNKLNEQLETNYPFNYFMKEDKFNDPDQDTQFRYF